jgi:glyoxylase-like metal-dependent hydrolase (beta-lactamase superfamily II)
MLVDWGEARRVLTRSVDLLIGEDQGRYPSANSLQVTGSGETVIIDPSVTVVARGGAPRPIDAVLNSHAHEDHMPGNGLFTDARLHIHEADRPGAASLDGLLDVFGFDGDERDGMGRLFVDEFHFAPRPDAIGFHDGAVFDLGGVTVEAVHLPGHTRGHSGFRISGGVFYLSDIDLTGFGPYYGDAWSDLDDFEASLVKVRGEDAAFYVTSHHKGVVEGRESFISMIDDFGAVIDRRHAAMLEYLVEPRTLAEMVSHRFVYRPHVEVPFADRVEARTAELHVQRMLERGEAREAAPGRYQRT